MSARTTSAKIATGDRFPGIGLRTCRDRPYSLDPRSSIVVFYRGHWCGHCLDQLLDLAHQADTFHALGFRLIAVSADDFVGANDMRTDTADAIEVLCDPGASAIRELGLEDRDEQVDHIIARPAVFLIDSEGTVRYRYISRSASDRPTSALLILAAESLTRVGRKKSVSA